MKKKKQIIVGIILIAIIVGSLGIYFLLRDKNRLTIGERKWLDNNINNVLNINVINNANIFGKDGMGVYYNFLDDFANNYKLTLNPITFKIGDNPEGITLGLKSNPSKNDVVMYKDHYVLVGKKLETIHQLADLTNKNIGILSSDLNIIAKYIDNANNLTLTQYDTFASLEKGFNSDSDYLLIPLLENLDYILKNNLPIVYHLSDIKVYYTLSLDNSILSRIINKYYNKWPNFNQYFAENEFKLFTKMLNITDTEIDALRSVEYNYGFINNSPYEVSKGGKYGGITAVYLSKFSKFAGIDINFNKYKNINKLKKAINKKDVDLYFNYYDLKDEYYSTKGLPISYQVITRIDNEIVIDSINSLQDKVVYVEKDSFLANYFHSKSHFIVKNYDNEKDLTKLSKKNAVIIMDKNAFTYYSKNKLNNYVIKYSNDYDNEYAFKVKNNSALYKLFNKYIETLDNKKITNIGINNHYETMNKNTFLSNIMEYILILLIIIMIVILLLIKKSKKICIAKKIKKDDKLKYIDQLTSLKNRNFLNENITIWNNNTIYPQTIIVIDLNKVQEINDLYGYDEGDKQIKAAANILIKTQLDNSEVMRTDGNEFVIYLMGYSQNQVTNYIHKLNKEIKHLPYDYGSEFGYSMITDNIKTIEDALNEAVEDVKKQKNKANEKQSKR